MFNQTPHHDHALIPCLFKQLNTDLSFGLDQDRQAKLHTDFADTYFYVFGFRGENTGDLLPEWMGQCAE